MKILVTGGAGYIGSVMARYFLDQGDTVTVLDNLSRGYLDAVPQGAIFVQGEISDLPKYFTETNQFDAVVHMAAHSRVEESVSNPELYWHNNVIGTIKLLDGMRKLEIPKLVFASTAAVYGRAGQSPITEDTPPNPLNTYGMTKLTMDMAIASEAQAHGLNAASLRFFNVTGAYRGAGERHNPETHLIPTALKSIVEGRVIKIFGSDYPTPDGTCIRDYIHVVDLALAAKLALEKMKSSNHNIFNLGNGDGFSNLEVIDAIKNVTGKTPKVEFAPRRQGDAPSLVASSKKIRQELGWVPTKPDLEEMILDLWNFENRH
ncbi:UDP-glucose 4-epimerase GalE [Acidithrix sp. C25]|uniref:UDP-glucose 4-epimerase GalE n=1 Tax=Acidithrix sp. C25 TaxID=1671482 RepID=UPI00191BA18D|nr:UDP-glucose 4-epimerase GalE [Acidithrix sp. C25]CAG4931730.1 unnamed protein product [Acidithrix sp. C25]